MKEIILCLLTLMRAGHGFLLQNPSIRSFSPFDTAINGYLDGLSQSQPEEDSNDEEVEQQQPPQYKNIPSGVVPSGRGPLGSYLDNMQAGINDVDASSSDDEKELLDSSSSDHENISLPEKPAKWSGAYLQDFLTNDDDSRTDIRNLLTQSSIQSFMRLLEECRDPHSAKWINEEFLETGNLLDFHGTGARFIEDFGGNWDAPLLAMIAEPKSRIIVSAKRRGRGHGGWSKNNPYLKERWVEIPIDIDPPNLASRIIAVREQIATEWVKDLDVLEYANDQILESFFKITKERRGATGCDGSIQGQQRTFERIAATLLDENSRFAEVLSSPFRRSNFDLMYNLSIQASVHRILRKQRSGGDEHTPSFIFLREFYTERAQDMFDGVQPFGRADDFMDELLQTSPSVTEQGLVDPVGVAEEIIKMRKEVARDWKALMMRVPEDHTGIRQSLFSNQIRSTSSYQADLSEDNSTFQ